MSKLRWRRGLKFFAGTAIAILMACLAWIAITVPALAVSACPGCFSFERIADGVYVDAEMPADQRSELRASLAGASASVSSFFVELRRMPRIVACASERCDKALGGRGARAVTYSSVGFSVLRLSPRGLDRMIVTHELAHVQVHARIGVLNQIRGTVPAWFDEGLAVVVSQDDRYVKSGASAADRCVGSSRDRLPASPFEWGPLSGRTPVIYAYAACAVLQWMEANGGRQGLLAALDDVAAGRRSLP